MRRAPFQRGGGARVTCKAGNNPLDEILSGSAMSLPTNPRLAAAARAVLAEPKAHVSSAALRHLTEPSSDSAFIAWQNYLTERGWLSASALESADKQTRLAGLAVLSAALTFPTSVARSWDLLITDQHRAHTSPKQLRLHVIGARAEAALPVHIWSELALLTGVGSLDIEFSGPAAAPEGVAVARTWAGPDGQRLNLKLAHPDLFHRSELGQALLAQARDVPAAFHDASHVTLPEMLPDAFVLFNPGLGEPGWERAWAPTMRALLAARRPLLMTALSTGDAARDVAFLEQIDWVGSGSAPQAVVEAPPYADSPFRSLLSANGDGLAQDETGSEGGGSKGAAGAANACFRVLAPRVNADDNFA